MSPVRRAWKRASKHLRQTFGGKLDICVPCAGINKNVPFLETSFEDHQRLISCYALLHSGLSNGNIWACVAPASGGIVIDCWAQTRQSVLP